MFYWHTNAEGTQIHLRLRLCIYFDIFARKGNFLSTPSLSSFGYELCKPTVSVDKVSVYISTSNRHESAHTQVIKYSACRSIGLYFYEFAPVSTEWVSDMERSVSVDWCITQMTTLGHVPAKTCAPAYTTSPILKTLAALEDYGSNAIITRTIQITINTWILSCEIVTLDTNGLW